MKFHTMLLLASILLFQGSANAYEHAWPTRQKPFDFSGVVGLYNPGAALEGLVAYRVLDDVLKEADDALSLETGLGLVFASSNIPGTGVGYTTLEIPLMARWDFFVSDGAVVVGPRAGFTILGGGIYFQVGAVAFFPIKEGLSIRTGLSLGGYSTLQVGLNLTL